MGKVKNQIGVYIMIAIVSSIVSISLFSNTSNSHNNLVTTSINDFQNFSLPNDSKCIKQINNLVLTREECGFGQGNVMYPQLSNCENSLKNCENVIVDFDNMYSSSPSDAKCIPNTQKIFTVYCSGSMLPTLSCEDTIIVCDIDGKSVDVGDIIVFKNGNGRNYDTLIHRVISKYNNGSMITRGDNNARPDNYMVFPENVSSMVIRVDYH